MDAPAEKALGLCCQVGTFYYDPWALLKLRLVSREIKNHADVALGDELSSGHWFSSFRGPPKMLTETNLGAMYEGLRRFCASLGVAPARFILSHTMIVDCSARNGTAVIAPPLSFLAQLCTIGVRIALTVRVVGRRDGICSSWQSETVSLNKVVPLPSLFEIHVSGRDAATKTALLWLLSCSASSAPPCLEVVTFMGYTLTEQSAAALMGLLAGQPRLKSLSLPQNTLSGLTLKELPTLTTLIQLDLSANYLNRSAELFAAALAPLPQIQRLNLSSNGLCGHLRTIASSFPPALTSLDLSANELGYDRSALGELLMQQTALTTLNLSYNHLRNKGTHGLPLSRLTALTLLDLTANEISPNWAPVGVPWLVRHCDDVGGKGKGFYLL
ncbi:MAG: hypothetical protein EB034_11195 [Verrucomicrobia bacterium]|nr:hypothetical protein [Verrucomicrobiota bacterium]